MVISTLQNQALYISIEMGGGSNPEHSRGFAASRGSGGKATEFGRFAMSMLACEPMEL
jgi:hypothetical protein